MAAAWLNRLSPTEDWDMRLIGVAAAGGSEADVTKLADPILASTAARWRLGSAE